MASSGLRPGRLLNIFQMHRTAHSVELFSPKVNNVEGGKSELLVYSLEKRRRWTQQRGDREGYGDHK